MRLVSQLNIIANAAPKALAEALDETATFILNWIRIFAPVKTGALRDSYKSQKLSPMHILIGSAIFYSIFQEYGTSKMSPRSHVAPAFALAENYLRQKTYEKMLKYGK